MAEISKEHNNGFWEGDFSVETDVSEAAERMRAGEAVAVDNDSVYAVCGDAASAAFVSKVRAIKSRESNRPFALTVPADRFLSFLDMDRVHQDARTLFEDPLALERRLGAFTFLRAPILTRTADDLPEGVKSESPHGPVAQDWFSKGKDNIDSLLVMARLEYAAVTSLNLSHKPEITEPDGEDGALAFARTAEMPVLTDRQACRIAKGSFPIIEVSEEGLTVIRTRKLSLGTTLLSRLLAGYTLRIPDAVESPPGLPIPDELARLQGEELGEGFRQHLGWVTVGQAE